MSSQITHTQSSTIHLLAHILDTCVLIFSSCAHFTVYPKTPHVMASNPSPGWIPPEHGRAVRKTRPSKNGCVKLIQLRMYQCSPLFPIFIVAEAPKSFLCYPRPPSHHPFSLTLVSLVLVLHLLPPSTPFWPYGAHPFFPHAQTISILFDPLYLLFIFQLSYPPLHC